MTVKAMLWTYRPKTNGACNIKIYANIHGQKKYFTTPFSVNREDFDSKRGLVKKSHPLHKVYNAQIKNRILEIESHFATGGSLNSLRKKKSNSILTYLTDFINDTELGLTGIEQSTVRTYKATLTRLKQYCKDHHLPDLFFDEISLEFYDDFRRYLIEGGHCQIPGFNNHVKTLKASMRLALEKGLHDNTIYQHRLFKKLPVDTNKIYLTEEEIKQIEDLGMEDDHPLSLERDRFLISYYFLTRYSDSVLIRRKDFFERNSKYYLRYFQKKTKKECVVPVREKAWSILRKRDFDLSGDTNQEANRKLKMIAAMAGIHTQTGEGDRYGPKWQFVTTHTARRSAATHLALQGVNLKIIADLGGWKKIETLRGYLRASGLDSAEVAKDLMFFK